ncbi:MAG TPA: alanine racemase [Candidatus Angelobacter sp.]|nr:alanine racemase [Candidatus Angelobacter sp.]
MSTPPSWVEVSLTALQHNFRTVLSYVKPEAEVCAIIKTDAYGHGAPECALALQKEGARWFGVTTAEEGIVLRERGITGRILLLSGLVRGEEEVVVKYSLTPSVWDWNHLELLEDAAEKLRPPSPIRVHLKLNTGMNRLGVDPEGLTSILDTIKSAGHVKLEGMFSHFASSEVLDDPFGTCQLACFQEAVKKAVEMGVTPHFKHMANSAAILTRSNSWFNLVRPGLALYGYCLPLSSVVTGQTDWTLELPVKPALSWKTRIVQIRNVPANQTVGYSSGYVTEFETKVAVISVGYGDGLNRQLSSRGRVIVKDDYASIIGNISMTLTAVDVTGIPGVEVGDEVTIIGETPGRKITAWEHAGLAGTIPYEILCDISPRVPRKYVE